MATKETIYGSNGKSIIRRGQGKEWKGFPGPPQSFRYRRRPMADCSPGRGGMAQDDRTMGGAFHGEIDRCRESQGSDISLHCFHAAAPAAGRPSLVVPGETTDTINHRRNSSVKDMDAACSLGCRRRWRPSYGDPPFPPEAPRFLPNYCISFFRVEIIASLNVVRTSSSGHTETTSLLADLQSLGCGLSVSVLVDFARHGGDGREPILFIFNGNGSPV